MSMVSTVLAFGFAITLMGLALFILVFSIPNEMLLLVLVLQFPFFDVGLYFGMGFISICFPFVGLWVCH
jgi:hypothetical protein